MLLKGKTAVVYGAGGSVGGAVARSFAREGATVFLAGRTRDSLEVVAAAIREAGGTADVRLVDALDGASVDRHVDQVVATTNRLDVSFNAIAVDHIQGVPLADLTEDEVVGPVAGRVATNLLTARAAGRQMIAQGSGVILTFTADAGPAGLLEHRQLRNRLRRCRGAHPVPRRRIRCARRPGRLPALDGLS